MPTSSTSWFFVKKVYHCILDGCFTKTLDGVASLVHLKVKFHNLHDEPIIVNVDLVGAKKTLLNLQDQKKGENKAIEIIVASPIGQLRIMNIRHYR